MNSVVPQHKQDFLCLNSRYECDRHEFIESKFHIKSSFTQILMKYNDIKIKHGMGMGGMCPMHKRKTGVGLNECTLFNDGVTSFVYLFVPYIKIVLNYIELL